MAETRKRIVLDAGHGGADSGSVYQGRKEKDDVLNLALSVGNILSDNGVDVIYTRTGDTYESPYEKAEMANRADADYLISFHRNSMETPNTGSGVEALVYREVGRAAEMAENINAALQEMGFRNLGVTKRPGLVLLKHSQMPAVMLEIGFIDSDADNAIFDSRYVEMAQAVANGIMEKLEQEDEERVLYRVQVGAFRIKGLADQLLIQLHSQGFPAFILEDDGFYKVQVGAFANMDNAVKMERTLRQYGYNTFLSR